jgi:hypothetical protein
MMARSVSRSPRAETEAERFYGCGAAARWLPRTLAAAVLVTAMFGVLRIDGSGDSLLPTVRRLVVVAGALLALGVARRGSEVRCKFGLTEHALTVAVGSRRFGLDLADIQRLDYAAPFSGSLNWLPATVLVDKDGRSWRVPALVDRGDELLEEILRRVNRHDLDSWAEVYRIVPRMGRYSFRIRFGYGVAAVIVLVGVGHYLH